MPGTYMIRHLGFLLQTIHNVRGINAMTTFLIYIFGVPRVVLVVFPVGGGIILLRLVPTSAIRPAPMRVA